MCCRSRHSQCRNLYFQKTLQWHVLPPCSITTPSGRRSRKKEKSSWSKGCCILRSSASWKDCQKVNVSLQCPSWASLLSQGNLLIFGQSSSWPAMFGWKPLQRAKNVLKWVALRIYGGDRFHILWRQSQMKRSVESRSSCWQNCMPLYLCCETRVRRVQESTAPKSSYETLLWSWIQGLCRAGIWKDEVAQTLSESVERRCTLQVPQNAGLDAVHPPSVSLPKIWKRLSPYCHANADHLTADLPESFAVDF